MSVVLTLPIVLDYKKKQEKIKVLLDKTGDETLHAIAKRFDANDVRSRSFV